ncbi:two pore domain potassium channel family protein [Lelliottia aquatilis]|nr:two pore domain potassium channel family protein [Lelliottia aquatilis]
MVFSILMLLIITVIIHSLWMLWIMRYVKFTRTSAFRIILRNILVVSTALVAHILEAGVFALYYFHSGALSTWESSLYFSLVSYATVGYGDVTLSGEWRLIGASEGLVGALMVGWSVAVLVVFLQRLRFMLDD